MNRRKLLAILLAGIFGESTQTAAAVWEKVCVATGSGTTWRKLGDSCALPAVTLTIASSTSNYNLRTAAIVAGWNGTSAVAITCTINAGVVVGSPSTGSFAFDTGTPFPSGSTLTLINNGSILGAGGTGGSGSGAGEPGQAGGTALRAQYIITVINNGVIGGGGGGGGGGYSSWQPGDFYAPTGYWANGAPGGGGGQGSLGGAGGPGGGGANCSGPPGPPGSSLAPGGGVNGSGCTGMFINSGGGGALGSAGGQGNGWNIYGAVPGAVGGAAGACTSGNSNITWTTAGNRYGALN